MNDNNTKNKFSFLYNYYRNIAIIRYMGASKTDEFLQRQQELAALMKALSHPARIAIIEHLLRKEQCICGDIVDELPLAQATVSQHLKELKQAGFIKGQVDGKAICYCLDKKAFGKVFRYFTEVKNTLACQKDPC
jgi:DNA-binding transcriptional ArsR family regulator